MKTNEILSKAAKENGMSVAQLRDKIQEVLDIGWNSSDPKAQAEWKKIPCKGEKPTLEEFMDYVVKNAGNVVS